MTWTNRFFYNPVKHQPDAVLSQANPVSATLYTVLAATKNVRIITIAVAATWTGQPSISCVITIDGITLTATFALPVTATYYQIVFLANEAQPQFANVANMEQYRAFLLEGRSIKVEVSATGGTVSNISARVKYAKM